MPNSIADNLQRLVQAKSNIATAITTAGGTVNAGDGFEDFPADIATIPTSASADGHKVVVTTLAGATVTLSKTGATYSGVANSSGVATINNVAAGTYTVTASMSSNGFTATSDSTSVTVQDHTATEDTFATISITASDDCDITISDGTTSETVSYTTGDTITQYASNNTSWTISTEIDDTPISQSVSVSGYSNYPVVLKNNTEWDDFRDLVRAGTASSQYPVGTLLYDKWGDNTSTAFRIVSYDQYFDADLTAQGYTHSVTLLEEYLDEDVVYDAPEAFLYLSQDLPVGTYYVKRSSTYYGFTTTATVPSGGQLCFKVASAGSSASTGTVQGYASKTAITPLFEVSTSSSSSGTNLGTFADNTTTSVTYGILNAYNRALYGNNNYYESGIRQLLNATTADNWWTPQTIFDRPTNTSMQGKLYRLNADFVNVLAAPNMTSIANTVGETAALDGKTFTTGATYTFKDKLFLAAPKELGLSDDASVGTTMSYYSGADNTKRKKYKKSATSTAGWWWLRTPYPSTSNSVRYIYTDGSLYSVSAYTARGSAAACVIQ